ncbi:hypothetical protein L208DRAFT_1443326 [Tricholoma matsutake]|nr:hypothetical protein L208DRAFT_1443326 [Tricholoma matsutake 945]
MDESISTSAITIRSFHPDTLNSVSAPSSPRSSARPSPPDSPSSDSVSSFPSVSSSFFFSSAAASPPHSRPQSDEVRDSTQGLIIPSLTLPAALRRPTPYGQTLGDIKLLVLGSEGAGKNFLTGLLLEDNEDVVDVGQWEDTEYGRVLRASTDWVEHRDAHGLEKFEPTRNVEIIELPVYDHTTDVEDLIQTIKSIIQVPFYTVSDILDPSHRPSAVVANLVSSASTPLHTALVFLLPSAPTVVDNLILESLSTQIPIIVLPRTNALSRSKLSSFRPASAFALRSGLFHSPETLAALRSEATDRFLRWREVEHTVDDIHKSRRKEAHNTQHRDPDGLPWDKTKWESEWAATLSQDVAKRLRENTLTERNVRYYNDEHRDVDAHDPSRSCVGHSFDPLHLPSLVIFSVSLLGPLRARVRKSISGFVEALGDGNVKAALLGGFCMGIGFGFFLKSSQ